MNSMCLLASTFFLFVAAPTVATDDIDYVAEPSNEPTMRWTQASPLDARESIRHSRSMSPLLKNVDPGEPPEGDYLGAIAFTQDGNRVLVTNKMTDNVTVFDWDTASPLANIPVGAFPRDIAVSDRYAVVPCLYSDEVYVIDLRNTSLRPLVFPTSPRPAVVRISPDGRYAYIACDTDDVCEVIDLDGMVHASTISGFPVEAYSSWSAAGNGRFGWHFIDFAVSADGAHLIVGNGDDKILFFNATTGEIEHTIDAERVRYIRLSGDGKKAVVISDLDPRPILQIDLETYSITGSVTLGGYWTPIYGALGVNGDGSKAIVGTSFGYSAIVRFETSDCLRLYDTSDAYWIGTSPNHDLAICGNKLSVVSFACESIISQAERRAGGVFGAVSPVKTRVACHDPVYSEDLSMFDYSARPTPLLRASPPSGKVAEGDGPKRVAITPDGTRALVVNVLSDNLTVTDLATLQNQSFIAFPEPAGVRELAITSDSRWAVVSAYGADAVKIIDLSTCSVAASVPTGENPAIVCISPDDRRAYVGNVGSNSISVIELAGDKSSSVAEIPCGLIGWMSVAYGQYSGVSLSPTGEYLLVAASFDDRVDVIDTKTNAVVSSLPVGEFPIRVCFNGDGDYAIVTNFHSDNYNVIHVDGASSSVVTTVSTAPNPLSMAYDAVHDEICVASYQGNRLYHVDPRTGNINSTDDYGDYFRLIQVTVDEVGEPIVLTWDFYTDYVIRDGVVVELPEVASYITYSPLMGRLAATIPGPDFLSVIDWSGAAAHDSKTTGSEDLILTYGQVDPRTSRALIHFSLPETRRVLLEIFDVTGRRIVKLAEGPLAAGSHALDWRFTGARNGVYFYRLTAGDHVVANKIVLLQ